MTEGRLSLGINVSILVILIIFGVLLSLPLRLLLDTNYTQDNSENITDSSLNDTETARSSPPIDFRSLKRCPLLEYRDRFKSVFRSDYDRNCSYIRHRINKKQMNLRLPGLKLSKDDTTNKTAQLEERKMQELLMDAVAENFTDDAEDTPKSRRMKSIPLAGHILVTMLLVSAIAAVIEVLRVRFWKDKHKDSPRGGAITPRRMSTIDLSLKRRFIPREPMKSQRSFELQGMHKSALRLLGARPAPLIRRSSFPTQPAKQVVSSISGTPTRMSRRQSAESDEEIGVLINALHHRTRLIRRH